MNDFYFQDIFLFSSVDCKYSVRDYLVDIFGKIKVHFIGLKVFFFFRVFFCRGLNNGIFKVNFSKFFFKLEVFRNHLGEYIGSTGYCLLFVCNALKEPTQEFLKKMP